MGFADEVSFWSDRTKARMLAVFQRAVVLLAEEMAKPRPTGATPHLTGNMIRSILARVNEEVRISDADSFAGTDVGLAVASALLKDEIFIGFQARYARRQNYGFVGTDSLGRNYNQSGAHFIERAVGLWPQMVDRAASEVGLNA